MSSDQLPAYKEISRNPNSKTDDIIEESFDGDDESVFVFYSRYVQSEYKILHVAPFKLRISVDPYKIQQALKIFLDCFFEFKGKIPPFLQFKVLHLFYIQQYLDRSNGKKEQICEEQLRFCQSGQITLFVNPKFEPDRQPTYIKQKDWDYESEEFKENGYTMSECTMDELDRCYQFLKYFCDKLREKGVEPSIPPKSDHFICDYISGRREREEDGCYRSSSEINKRELTLFFECLKSKFAPKISKDGTKTKNKSSTCSLIEKLKKDYSKGSLFWRVLTGHLNRHHIKAVNSFITQQSKASKEPSIAFFISHLSKFTKHINPNGALYRVLKTYLPQGNLNNQLLSRGFSFFS
jgi:hypothetical protein